MKALVSVLVVAGLLAVSPAYAEDAKSTDSTAERNRCEVPADLLTTDNVLNKVADKIKSTRALDILVIGSGSSTLNGTEGAISAYPARLEFYLSQKLPEVTVHVTTDLHLKQTAEEVAEAIAKIAGDRKPTLAIWQTGTVDAMRSIDPDDFRTAIIEGIASLKTAGAAVILMNLQYNPRIEAVLSVTAYLDNMRVVAQEQDVPLFDRFAIMRHWNLAGTFDLSTTTHSLSLAKDVHDCLGRVLANFVMETSRINPADLRTQR